MQTSLLDFRLERIDTREAAEEASALYIDALGLDPARYVLNPHLLLSIAANGGTAIAARDGERMIGFCYGFTGIEAGVPYHFSQAAAVTSHARNRGIGRALKRAQAEDVRAEGITSMRWVFDPLKAHNAHLNLDVLGATGIRVVRRLFGTPESTRLVVEWRLDRPARDPRPASMRLPDAAEWGTTVPAERGEWLMIPAEPPEESVELRERIADALEAAFDAGRRAVSCRRLSSGTAAVLLAEVDA